MRSLIFSFIYRDQTHQKSSKAQLCSSCLIMIIFDIYKMVVGVVFVVIILLKVLLYCIIMYQVVDGELWYLDVIQWAVDRDMTENLLWKIEEDVRKDKSHFDRNNRERPRTFLERQYVCVVFLV